MALHHAEEGNDALAFRVTQNVRLLVFVDR